MAYINCVNRAPFNNYQAGNYVEINWTPSLGSLNFSDEQDWETRCLLEEHVFDDVDDIKKIEGEWEGIEDIVRDGNGNFLLLTGEYLGEIAEINQRYQASIEDRRYVNQMQRWTSYDMPPKPYQ
jgi:hypothetical protein